MSYTFFEVFRSRTFDWEGQRGGLGVWERLSRIKAEGKILGIQRAAWEQKWFVEVGNIIIIIIHNNNNNTITSSSSKFPMNLKEIEGYRMENGRDIL